MPPSEKYKDDIRHKDVWSENSRNAVKFKLKKNEWVFDLNGKEDGLITEIFNGIKYIMKYKLKLSWNLMVETFAILWKNFGDTYQAGFNCGIKYF